MTRSTGVGGTRSGRPERVRFVRALLFSVLLHASVLTLLKAGPPPGRGMTSAPAGGVFEASFRPAAPDLPPPSLPAPLTAQLPTQLPAPELPLIVTLDASTWHTPSSESTSPAVLPPVSAAPSSASSSANPQRAGIELATGAGAGGEDSVTIPLLPPLPALQGLPRRPSLLAPVRFSYPPNIPVQGGRVRVRILLDNKGKVEEMRVVTAAPPGVFDHAALAVLRSGRYAPGFVGVIALRSYLFMEVSFGPGPQGQQVWYAGDAMAPADYRVKSEDGVR